MKDILREIGMIARSLDSISNIEFKEYDLTKGQYLYLVRICENPGIILEKLSELIKVDRTTAARAIQKLEANHLIEKKADPINKKIKCLFPLIMKEHHYSTQIAVNGLSEKEQLLLATLLHRVRKNVEVSWEHVKKGKKREY